MRDIVKTDFARGEVLTAADLNSNFRTLAKHESAFATQPQAMLKMKRVRVLEELPPGEFGEAARHLLNPRTGSYIDDPLDSITVHNVLEDSTVAGGSLVYAMWNQQSSRWELVAGDIQSTGAGQEAEPDVVVEFVKLDSTTKTGGYYPGHWQEYDPETQAWTQKDLAWVFDPNGGTVDTSTYYPAKLLGHEEDEQGESGDKEPLEARLYTTSLGGAFTVTSQGIVMDNVGSLGPFDSVDPDVGNVIFFNPGTSAGGVYSITIKGDGATNGTLARIPGMNASSDITAGMLVRVTAGTTYANTLWALTTTGPYTLGTTALTFVESAVAGDAGARAVWGILRGIEAAGLGTGDSAVFLARVRAVSLPNYTRTGNTITATANGALAAIDGVTLVADDPFFFDNGSADAGIWRVTEVGDGSHPFICDRASQWDTSGDFITGKLFAVQEGTLFKQQLWMMVALQPFTLNSNAPLPIRVPRTAGSITSNHVVLWDSVGNVKDGAASQSGTDFLTNGVLVANAGTIKVQNPAGTDHGQIIGASSGLDIRAGTGQVVISANGTSGLQGIVSVYQDTNAGGNAGPGIIDIGSNTIRCHDGLTLWDGINVLAAYPPFRIKGGVIVESTGGSGITAISGGHWP